MNKFFLVVLICVGVACAPGKSQTSGNSNPTNTTVSTRGVITSGGNVIAYVLQFLAVGEMFVYVPSVSKYARVNQLTGAYFSGSTLYYSSSNCSGTPIMTDTWYGEIGKYVMSDGTNYYVATSIYSSGTPLPWGSQGAYDVFGFHCFNTAGGTYTGDGKSFAQITATTQPYNFSAIAPLTISYP